MPTLFRRNASEPSASVQPQPAEDSDGLSRRQQGDLSSDSARSQQSTAGRLEPVATEELQPKASGVDVGTQTVYTGNTALRKRRRRSCGCIFNKWTASLVATAAVVWAAKQPLTHVQDKVVETIAPHVPEYLSNKTELQRKLGIEIPSIPMLFSEDEGAKRRPGKLLHEQGYRPKHPVIVVPGFVTSGLELWQGKPCATRFFRERIWGQLSMTHAFVRNSACWLEHMALDEVTGGDPPGVKLRAAEGLEAVDYFMPGYHVWAKLIEALADVGYDSNMLVGETYDWRLAVPIMQKRDGYFTRLRARIEIMHKLQGEKVMVMSHSWGDNVFRNFMAWATSDDPDWVEQHIAVYANIAGPTLGVPKSISSFLSGETRDTAELGFIAALLSDSMMPRNERVRLFRTWGAGIGMLPSGGPDIWGNTTWAPDDTPDMRAKGQTYGSFLTEYRVDRQVAVEAQRHHSSLAEFITHYLEKRASPDEQEKVKSRHDIDSAMKILLAEADQNFRDHVTKWAAVHVDKRSCHCHGDAEEYYFSPLNCPLPTAPSLQMFCLYGVGLDTERAYHYINLQSPNTLEGTTEGEKERQQEILWKINSESNEANGTLDHGIMLTDGDGTVPLISLGTLCAKHWRHKHLNPSSFRVVSREFKHEPVHMFKDFRGGGKSSDHVDILSNDGVLSDIVKMAAGQAGKLQDNIHSRIEDIVAEMPVHAE